MAQPPRVLTAEARCWKSSPRVQPDDNDFVAECCRHNNLLLVKSGRPLLTLPHLSGALGYGSLCVADACWPLTCGAYTSTIAWSTACALDATCLEHRCTARRQTFASNPRSSCVRVVFGCDDFHCGTVSGRHATSNGTPTMLRVRIRALFG